MGKEIRMVPPTWEHPRDERGEYVPLFDRSYEEAVRDYEYMRQLWEEGRHPSQIDWPTETAGLTLDQWDGGPPDPGVHRQESWREDQATAWILYENISEGTPISPKFESLEALFAWMRASGYVDEDVAEIQRNGQLPTGRVYFADEQ